MSFLNKGTSLLLLIIPLIIFGIGLYTPKFNLEKLKKNSHWYSFLIIAVITSFLFLCFFPMQHDFYGNARSFTHLLDKQVLAFPKQGLEELFSLNIIPGQGRNGVKILIDLISYSLKIDYQSSFILLGALCGIIYLFLLIYLIQINIKSVGLKVVLLFVFTTSPIFLIFFGHIETYAPVFLILLILLILNIIQLKSKKLLISILQFVILIIGIRFHTLFVFVIPILLISNFHFFFPILANRLLSFKNLILYFYVPSIILGSLLYFFYFEDYNDPRKLSNFQDIDRLFLPILSPEAPLDKYNLFSLSHLFDYVNILFFWSPAILFLIGVILNKRKLINWNSPELSGPVLSLLMLLSFLFAINPLMSMPMDWDLFMFPVTLLFTIIICILSQLKKPILSSKIKLNLIALSILSFSSFICILSTQANSLRVESIGKHVFKTYYEHASTYLLYALNLSESNEVYLQKEEQLITDLKSFALLGNDKQYADLLHDYSLSLYTLEADTLLSRQVFLSSLNYYPPSELLIPFIEKINLGLIQKKFEFSAFDKSEALRYLTKGRDMQQANEIPEAVYFYKLSTFFNPKFPLPKLRLMELHFNKKRFKEAYTIALELQKLKYFDRKKELKILIHTSLETKSYNDSKFFIDNLIKEFPNDKLGQQLITQLNKTNNIESLSSLFMNLD